MVPLGAANGEFIIQISISSLKRMDGWDSLISRMGHYCMCGESYNLQMEICLHRRDHVIIMIL